METCLKTQLKSVIQNDNLTIFGGITLAVDNELAASAALSSRRFKMQFVQNSEVELKNVGGNFLDSNGNSLGTIIKFTATGGMNDYYFSADTKYIIIPKYTIELIDNVNSAIGTKAIIYPKDISEYVYATSLANFTIAGEEAVTTLSEIGKFKGPLSVLFLSNTTCSGDISLLSGVINKLNNITLGGIPAFNITGDIASLAPYVTEQKTIRLSITRSNRVKLTCNGVRLGLDGSGGYCNYDLAFDGAGHVTCTVVS
jgi:hypothetical protein